MQVINIFTKYIITTQYMSVPEKTELKIFLLDLLLDKESFPTFVRELIKAFIDQPVTEMSYDRYKRANLLCTLNQIFLKTEYNYYKFYMGETQLKITELNCLVKPLTKTEYSCWYVRPVGEFYQIAMNKISMQTTQVIKNFQNINKLIQEGGNIPIDMIQNLNNNIYNLNMTSKLYNEMFLDITHTTITYSNISYNLCFLT